MKRLAILLIFVLLASGCIRLAGSAGYYKQGKDDEAPVSKSVGFDTQELVQ